MFVTLVELPFRDRATGIAIFVMIALIIRALGDKAGPL